MKIKTIQDINKRVAADFLVIPYIESKKVLKPLCDITKFKKYISAPISTHDFLGKEKSISMVYTKSKDKRIILLGFGSIEKLDSLIISEVYAELVKFLKSQKAASVNIIMPQDLNIEDEVLIQTILESLILSSYSFNKFKNFSKKDEPVYLKEITLIGIEKEFSNLVNKTKHLCDGVNLTRDLVNNNAYEETPEHLALTAKELEKISDNLKVTLFDKKRIEKEKMGLLLAVNQGSDKDPVFIIVEYKGDPSSDEVSAIVGKGITYDTGGLSLKPTLSMDTMKADMAGAAAILGTMYTIANLKLKVNVTALIPATENSIGSKAYKPGDVYISMANKSVEVKNTDAEGRLILADALYYAATVVKPKRIIDLATLTGACVVALGEDIAALFSNNEDLAESLLKASSESKDVLWRMPLYKDYLKILKSDIADIRNVGTVREAGAITAALFLHEFIDNIAWAHIDIAGPAYLNAPKSIHPTNATGVGVRLLTKFFEKLSK